MSLTDGHTDGNRRGYFFRTVPNDAVQGPMVANYMTKKLKWKRVYIIDDQETYSQGLADGVQSRLKAKGVKRHPRLDQPDTTRTSRRRSRRSRATPQVIYIPWQLAPQAQAFGQQLKAAGKPTSSCSARTACSTRRLEDHGLVRLVLPVQPGRSGSEGVHGGPRRRRRVLRRSRPTWRPRWSSARSRGRARTARQPAPRCASRSRRRNPEDLDPRLPGRRSQTNGELHAPAGFGDLPDPEETARTSASARRKPLEVNGRAAHHRMGRTSSLRGLRAA